MQKSKLPYLIPLLLLVICFGLAAWLEPRAQARERARGGDVMSLLLGDSRRMFANHFFIKADAYFHSGFYPTVFDNQESFQTAHMAEDADALKGKNRGDETAFMGKPRDVIEAFTRHFMPSTHTHLDQGGAQPGRTGSQVGEGSAGEVREILPWLRISAGLDPHRIETYMVTAYWLRKRMGKVKEAESFLREGLRENPGNPSILFELGRVYQEDRQDPGRARNLWEAAVHTLDSLKQPLNEQDDFMRFQLCLNLARLEEGEGNLAAAVHWLEREKTASPNPKEVEKQIKQLLESLAAGAGRADNPVAERSRIQ